MNLKEKYQKEIVPELMKIFKYKNPYQVPRIEKVVVNTGFGKLVSGKKKEEKEKIVENFINDLALITGQRPILTKARKSISGFKIKRGEIIGAKVTLRGKRMYDFLERLIHIVLPRIRDFKGIKESQFDSSGNLTIGISEQIVFPEISPEKTKFNFGLEVTIVSNAKKREEGIELMRALGFPIKKQ